MITHFRPALNDVKAEKNLLNRTEHSLKAELATAVGQRSFSSVRALLPSARVLAALAGMAVFLIAGSLNVYQYYWTPVAYLSVDINPSVDIGINAFDRVISTKGLNTDGQAVLIGVDLRNASVSDAVQLLLISAIDKNYVAVDGTTVILLGSATDDADLAGRLNTDAATGARAALTARQRQAKILVNRASLKTREEAHSLGITAGKLTLIKQITALDSQASLKAYKNAGLKNILADLEQAESRRPAENRPGTESSTIPGSQENSPADNQNEIQNNPNRQESGDDGTMSHAAENSNGNPNSTTSDNTPNNTSGNTNTSPVNGPAENSASKPPDNNPDNQNYISPDNPQNLAESSPSGNQNTTLGPDNTGPASQSDSAGPSVPADDTSGYNSNYQGNNGNISSPNNNDHQNRSSISASNHAIIWIGWDINRL